MDTRPEYQLDPELTAKERRERSIALEKHTSPPPSRAYWLGQLKCRNLEREALSTEIDYILDQLDATPA